MTNQPIAETWKVFDVRYPNDYETFYCDEETAEYIARLLTNDEWSTGTFIAERA